MSEFERKPDGGLNAWIETYEAMGGDETDAEMLCLLLELRRHRENQAEIERERDELRGKYQEVSGWYAKMKTKMLSAEAELRRRDAAAGEPVADMWLVRKGDGTWEECGTGYHRGRAVYFKPVFITAALPAVLPELEQDVKNIIGLLSGNEWAEHCTKSELGRKLENEITELHNTYSRAPAVVPPAVMKHLSDAANTVSEWTHGDEHSCKVSRTALITAIEALGAQPQKVVELPAASVPHGWKLVPLKAFPSQWAAGQKAFDAAGINKIDPVYHAMVEAAPEPGGDDA